MFSPRNDITVACGSVSIRFRKKRAATPQTSILPAMEIGHKNIASCRNDCQGLRDRGSQKRRIGGGLLAVKISRTAELYCSSIRCAVMGILQQYFPSLLSFCLLYPFTAASQAATCNLSIYGNPKQSDCLTLFEKFTSQQSPQARFFVEEQLRVDSNNTWPGVTNVFEQPIVQLPKFYAMSMFTSCAVILLDG